MKKYNEYIKENNKKQYKLSIDYDNGQDLSMENYDSLVDIYNHIIVGLTRINTFHKDVLKVNDYWEHISKDQCYIYDNIKNELIFKIIYDTEVNTVLTDFISLLLKIEPENFNKIKYIPDTPKLRKKYPWIFAGLDHGLI